MKGFLSFLVLHLISKNEMSGDEIRKEIEQRKGCLPSAGTVYPVLKDLKLKGLIEDVGVGKKVKKYRITSEGKKEMKIVAKEFVGMFYDVSEGFGR